MSDSAVSETVFSIGERDGSGAGGGIMVAGCEPRRGRCVIVVVVGGGGRTGWVKGESYTVGRWFSLGTARGSFMCTVSRGSVLAVRGALPACRLVSPC